MVMDDDVAEDRRWRLWMKKETTRGERYSLSVNADTIVKWWKNHKWGNDSPQGYLWPPVVNQKPMYEVEGEEKHDNIGHDGGHVNDPPNPS